MCGIVGQVDFRTAPDPQQVRAARDLLTYRGPDDAGEFHDACAALGFRRLSILDLSAAGHQPMKYERNGAFVIFNGEIYNFIEVREELRQRGHAFRSQADSEVILAAFAEWDTACFEKFNGMWAIALWDPERRRLVLSRDRFGEKPLYYHLAGSRITFASEIKAVLHLLPSRPEPNQGMIFDYLAFAFHDHTDDTFFSGIKQLLPGHTAVVTPDGMKVAPYWRLSPARNSGLSFDQVADRFRELFTDSVRLRLRSDVPIGSALSGGLDSSTIVLTAFEQLQQQSSMLQQKTFTAASADPRFDERKYSRLVNERVGAQAFEIIPDPEEYRRIADELLWHQEEPYLSMSMFAQWEVMRTAKSNGVTVMLDGQGGDEILAGYLPFYGSLLAQELRTGRAPAFIRQVRSLWNHHRASMTGILPTFALYLLPPALGRPIHRLTGTSTLGVLEPGFARQQYRYPELPQPTRNVFKNHLYRLLTGTGLRALLHYEDRNSMAHSIEARVPFLDHRLAEFALGLPDEYLLSGHETKRLLRRAFADLLPKEILTRKDKMGFVVPQENWMRGPLAEDIRSSLNSPHALFSSYLRPAAVAEQVASYYSGYGRTPYGVVWRWYMLNAWLHRFFR